MAKMGPDHVQNTARVIANDSDDTETNDEEGSTDWCEHAGSSVTSVTRSVRLQMVVLLR